MTTNERIYEEIYWKEWVPLIIEMSKIRQEIDIMSRIINGDYKTIDVSILDGDERYLTELKSEYERLRHKKLEMAAVLAYE